MNAPDDRTGWLRAEVDESLDAMGYIGLYEVTWTINGAGLGLGRAEAHRLARSVVADVLAEPGGGRQLRRLTWPGALISSPPLPPTALDDESSWVEGETYVALIGPELLATDGGA